MRKILSVFLIIALTACMFAGCSDTVNEIAGSVAEAARAELEVQVKAALEEHKLEVIEIKTGFGKLNDDGGEVQYFIAALVRTENTDLIEASLAGLNMIFTDTGILPQTDSKIESAHLVHKELSYTRSDYTDGTYYTVYAYYDDLTKFVPNAN